MGHWAEVKTWPSNFAASNPAALRLGDLVYGVLTSSYDAYMTTILETWPTCSTDRWNYIAHFPPADPWGDFDIRPVAIDALPCLGGCAFYYRGDDRVAGIRLAPPPLEARRYFQ